MERTRSLFQFRRNDYDSESAQYCAPFCCSFFAGHGLLQSCGHPLPAGERSGSGTDRRDRKLLPGVDAPSGTALGVAGRPAGAPAHHRTVRVRLRRIQGSLLARGDLRGLSGGAGAAGSQPVRPVRMRQRLPVRLLPGRRAPQGLRPEPGSADAGGAGGLSVLAPLGRNLPPGRPAHGRLLHGRRPAHPGPGRAGGGAGRPDPDGGAPVL